ncbi:MAG: hypothetical protein R3C11_06835 [Planctomycetaceae bacterium]
MNFQNISRRDLLKTAVVGTFSASLLSDSLLSNSQAAEEEFKLNYILNSAMYGYTDVETILGEVHKTGTKYIDIWPKRHGDQREQIEAMGYEAFKTLLDKYAVKLGIVTCYVKGPFNLAGEMEFAHTIAGPGTIWFVVHMDPKIWKAPHSKLL